MPGRLFAAALAASLLAAPAAAQNLDARFRQWLQDDLWPEARGNGISAATFNAAFAGVSVNLKLPDLVLPGQKPQTPKTQHQAEFGAPGNYFAENTVAGVASGGRARAARLKPTLDAIERRTGVPAGVLLAVWGRESGFGAANIPHNAFEVLATKAFLATRKEMFRKEVLAALEMVERRHVSVAAMKSSWAGALGQPQFLPSSYLKYAVDADGNDRAGLRARVFQDDAARRRLEAIVHPRILEAAVRRAAEAGGAYQVIVAPLLVEFGLVEWVDRVLVVDCPEEQQLRRLLARDGGDEALARAILAAQASREQRLAAADDLIVNDGPLVRLNDAVLALDALYREIAATGNPRRAGMRLP